MRAVIVMLLLAGCAAPEPEPVAEIEPVDDVPAVEMVLQDVPGSVPVDWDGRTKEGFWVCNTQDGTTACPAGQQVQPDGQHATTVAYTANVTAIHLNVTWTPVDATQTGLVFAVYGNVSGSGPSLLQSVRGTWPLTVSIEDPGLVPDGSISMLAWPEGKTPTSPSVFVDVTRQGFTVEGVILTVDQEWVEVEKPS